MKFNNEVIAMPRVQNKRKREITKRIRHNDLPLSRTRKRNKGFDVRLLNRMEIWLDYVTKRYSKSYFVRIDLTYPDQSKVDRVYADDNVLMREFMDTFKRWYTRRKIRTDYYWVRERSTTGNQHYHVMFVLDGNIVRSRWPVLERAQILWAKKLKLESGKGYVECSRLEVNKIERRFLEMENSNPYRYETLFSVLSYMGKVYQKDTPKGLNEFGHSRIPNLRESEVPDLFPDLIPTSFAGSCSTSEFGW